MHNQVCVDSCLYLQHNWDFFGVELSKHKHLIGVNIAQSFFNKPMCVALCCNCICQCCSQIMDLKQISTVNSSLTNDFNFIFLHQFLEQISLMVKVHFFFLKVSSLCPILPTKSIKPHHVISLYVVWL